MRGGLRGPPRLHGHGHGWTGIGPGHGGPRRGPPLAPRIRAHRRVLSPPVSLARRGSCSSEHLCRHFGGAVAAAIAAMSTRAEEEHRLERVADAWPAVLEEMRVLAGAGGRPLPHALFHAGRRTPPPISVGFAAAEREWHASTDFGRALDVLKTELAEASTDVICETLLVAHQVGGTGVEGRLEAVIEDRVRGSRPASRRSITAGGRALRSSLRARGADRDGVRGAVAGYGTRGVSGARCASHRRPRTRADRRVLGVGRPHPSHPSAAASVHVSRTVVALGLVVWVGMTLALAETRWARRMSIARAHERRIAID